MSLHTEYLFLNQARNAVDNSKSLFHLAEISKYAQDKTLEYAEKNKKQGSFLF